jgi:tellurite methyltransferase
VSQGWTRYYDAAGVDPRPTVLAALERFDRESPGARFAVDLGCGTGRDTLELLRRGWRVLAIDSQAEAIERLRAQADLDGASDRLETLTASFETANWPDADLVNASFALPFTAPETFDSVWQRLTSSLRLGGRFCGQLFGERDEWVSSPPTASGDWSSPPAMTFHSRADVDRLLGDFDVEQLEEIEEDGTTAVGDPKHWHLFHVVARKH